ncbi:MAG: hypothetical protein LBF51_02780 [Zoogloeaceae bacterium]|jgi:hypothetical protein|nr:hypothetical protein [Zoogloeaceae bacterium]
MTANNFRLLLIASLVLGVASIVFSFVPPLPEGFLLAEQGYAYDISPWRVALILVILIAALLMLAFACYGLFRLRAWGPRLALWATVLMFLVYLPILDYCMAQFGIAILLELLNMCVWGAVLAISLSPAYKTRFQACPPPEKS